MKVCIFFLVVVLFNIVDAHTNSYYDIINAITEGKDLYSILEVNHESTLQEIRKSFRKLSLS